MAYMVWTEWSPGEETAALAIERLLHQAAANGRLLMLVDGGMFAALAGECGSEQAALYLLSRLTGQEDCPLVLAFSRRGVTSVSVIGPPSWDREKLGGWYARQIPALQGLFGSPVRQKPPAAETGLTPP